MLRSQHPNISASIKGKIPSGMLHTIKSDELSITECSYCDDR